MIAGGGIGDGDIDGKVFVHVIDGTTDAPLASATVAIGGQELMTDAKGFVELKDVEGPQTIAVKLQGYRPAVWDGANGKNVTIPLAKLSVDQATLSGSIPGWDTITVPAQHIKAAAIFYSQSRTLGDEANDLPTPNGGNICLSQSSCNWTVVSRTGTVTIIAAIVDRDTKGTLTDPNDDTQTIIGWAVKTGVSVAAGVNQTGITLDRVEAGNLETLTVDFGTPPASLTTRGAFIGFEVGDDEVVQIPMLEGTTVLAPKASVFGATGMRLAAVAQTTSGDLGAQSITLRRGVSGTTLAAGTWLTPPVGVTATRTTATWTPVADAALHSVQYRDPADKIVLEVTVFDNKLTTTAVPGLVALPASGALTARVQAIGADIDPQDFSLEEDEDKVTGIAVQPVQIP